jgi:hypothetical protein
MNIRKTNMKYRIWYSKQPDYNWVIQDAESDEIFKVNHVDIQVPSETEESARTGSFPPPYTILVEGELKVDNWEAVISLGKEDSCI